MRHWLAVAALLGCSTIAFGQSFEAGVSVGQSLFQGDSKNLGTAGAATDPQYKMNDGFRISARMAINPYRFFGYEFEYTYNHTSIAQPAVSGAPGLPGQGSTSTPAQNISVPIHQLYGNFLVYATPEGTHVRPFVTGGVGFSSFFPPGTSVYYGNQTTKFGVNYGGGLKVRVSGFWGVRFDVRWYNTSKPFDLPFQSGRLNMLGISGGISVNM
jgi:opacity protein-like surface antigen